jgi:MoaA/NifB/PqqE/SkfB family radical SAM enzyme
MRMGEQDQQEHLRSWDIVSLLSPRPLWRVVRGIVRAPLDPDFAGSPLAVCWFVTFACNARCGFCCKAAEIRAGREEFPPLPLDEARGLMERIRRTVDILYLSGGEPLVHPHIAEILAEARRLKFASVGMSSNLIALDEHAGVLDNLDAVGVSIHGPDAASHARCLRVPEAVAERVFRNLDLLAERHKAGGLKVIVNCVINPDNIAAVAEMVDFTAGRGFLLEIVPANDRHGVTPELANDPAYAALLDRLLELRRGGKAPHLAGSTAYYKRLKSMRPFRCFPYGVPNIMPDGRLCTPCDVSGQHEVSVLDHHSLKAAVEASRPMLGNYPCREGHCFKAGIMERSRLFGLLLNNPAG